MMEDRSSDADFEGFISTLDELMEARGLNDNSLTRAAGLSHGYVNKFRHRQAVPKLPTIKKLAKALGVSWQSLEASGASQSAVPVGMAELELAPFDGKIATPPKGLDGAAYSMRVGTKALGHRNILPGDILVFDPGAAITHKAVVQAQVYDLERDSAETVLREYFEPPQGQIGVHPQLLADSTIGLDPLAVDNVRVRVVARAVRRFVDQAL